MSGNQNFKFFCLILVPEQKWQYIENQFYTGENFFKLNYL